MCQVVAGLPSDDMLGRVALLWKAADVVLDAAQWMLDWFAIVRVMRAYVDAYSCIQGGLAGLACGKKWCRDVRYLAGCPSN